MTGCGGEPDLTVVLNQAVDLLARFLLGLGRRDPLPPVEDLLAVMRRVSPMTPEVEEQVAAAYGRLPR